MEGRTKELREQRLGRSLVIALLVAGISTEIRVLNAGETNVSRLETPASVLIPNNQETVPQAVIDAPDPATPWLLGIGLITVSLLRRRARSKQE